MKKKPPGSCYLVSLGHRQVPEASKCEHNRGQWLVYDGEYVYRPDPPTQLQKDIWLGSGNPDVKEKARRIAMLRWLCFECGTMQTP